MGRDGLKALADVWLVGIVGILDHIVLIFVDDGFVYCSHFAHVVGFDVFVYSCRQAADNDVAIEELLKGIVYAFRDWNLALEALADGVDGFLSDAVCPKEFFKVKRTHGNDGLIAHRN